MKNFCLFLSLLFAGVFNIQAQTILSGDYKITGTLQLGNMLDMLNTTPNTTQAVLARLPEGGVYLSVKAYNSQPVNCKMFAIEQTFYGNVDNSINFYRGGADRDGSITFSVYGGREISKFSYRGLDVYGMIQAKQVLISETGWADYVFAKDYQLPSLNEVKQYIDKNKHLPGIPTGKEVKENGVNLGDMQTKLLQKIEELTLYTIHQQEMIDKLNARIEQLEKK